MGKGCKCDGKCDGRGCASHGVERQHTGVSADLRALRIKQYYDRIRLLSKLEELYHRYPMRFCQLIVNVSGRRDPFYVEDAEFVALLDKALVEGLESLCEPTGKSITEKDNENS